MVHCRSPSFFKILLDASAPHLPLPPDFASKYLKSKIPKYPIIRSVIGGYSWRLRIKKIGESYCFSDGWSNVVEDIQLGFGDFLVFRFLDKSIFELVVFSPNGCEKDFPPKIYDESVTVDDDNDVVVRDVEDEDDDDDDDDVVVKDVEEDEVEVEDEDEDDEEEEEYEDEKDEGDDEDDGEGDDDDGGDIDGNDGDPFFMMIISKSHKGFMRLPVEFVELAGINGERTLTLKNLNGNEWQTVVRIEKWNQSERYLISAGWTDFRRSNDISEGDECVFKFIRSEDKLLLARVTKKKRPANQPERNSIETPATEVIKQKLSVSQPERNSGETPATEVPKPKGPARNFVVTPATEVVKRRVQPKRNSGVVPKTGHGGGVSSRGRTGKRRRRIPAR